MSENLAARARGLAGASLLDLFARDPARAEGLALQWGDWRFDFSKERVDTEALGALVAHAEAIGVPRWIDALFNGERVNLSEARPALHTALRPCDDRPVRVSGEDVIPAVRATQQRIRALAGAIREGRRRGATGKPITDVVSIGIGGSDLGPRMVCDALAGTETPPVRVGFVSNVDPEALARAIAPLDPATTAFVVVSKTFTTQETLANATAARDWLARSLPSAGLGPHFIGVSANVAAAGAFGIAPDDVLPMWDWVGGRYSLWSAVGLPIAIRCGPESFDALLAGAAEMDTHVRSAPLRENAAALLALVGWWNARFLGHPQRLVIPYSHALRELAAYLQQLVLESNGKGVARDGAPLPAGSTPSLWGEPGTDAQHSFFQWLHQGTHPSPVEFVVPVRARHPIGVQQRLLVANALAQAQALCAGRTPDTIRSELAGGGLDGEALDAAIAARVCPGNRPSTTILMPEVNAHHLGALIALYEHRTFIEGLLYGINSFDQWGVELGKTLAKPIARALIEGAPLPAAADPSTRAMVAHAKALLDRA
jgi:glucose-6-phosphate isomerase